jgi:glutamate-1-semialdehyde 2,1-aminomutase
MFSQTDPPGARNVDETELCMATDALDLERSSARLDEVIAEQEAIFVARQPRSGALTRRAVRSLPGGVTSSWQITKPQVVWISHGAGAYIYDVDGNEYLDMHGGYGAGLAGHAHPAIVEAVRRQAGLGTHFAQPTEAAVEVAEELARRFGLPLWRFCNSGTESTMEALHLMRAVTGRDLILKVEGCYHGHHDFVQVSVLPHAADIGPRQAPASVLASSGIPGTVADLTVVVPFNDLAAVADALDRHDGRVAGMILEPIMMNAGIIEPDEGYLAGLVELLHSHRALVTFDEVKTGLTVGPGGATALYGVTPDIICLAKSVGGGIVAGAVGGSVEVMGAVADGRYEMVGTFNGNPLATAAMRAMLFEVARPDAYDPLFALADKLASGVADRIATHDLPAHEVSVGAKGCATFSRSRVRDYRDFLTVDDRYNHAHWLFQHNGGVFLPPWGKTEQWLVSVQHDDAGVERFLSNFERFAEAVA